MKKLPVFVFPISLEFYLGARHTHKQLLTLYNPYDFAVNFKVLCTSPNKFTVMDPDGVISPQSCIDIVIRYNQPSMSHCQATDKFRITMIDRNNQQTLGKRDVPAKFLAGEPENLNVDVTGDNFQPTLGKNSSLKGMEEPSPMCLHPTQRHQQQPVNIIAVGVGVACIGALLLPIQAETSPPSALPEYLHISVHLKLVISFVLGLVSMVVLRP